MADESGQRESRANNNGFDKRLLIHGYQDYLKGAWNVLHEYTSGLYDIACKYHVWKEVELDSEKRKRGERGDGGNSCARSATRVQGYLWHEFGVTSVEAESVSERDNRFPEKVLAKAAAWYYCAYNNSDDTVQDPYLSFAWLAVQPMCQLRRQIYGTASI